MQKCIHYEHSELQLTSQLELHLIVERQLELHGAFFLQLQLELQGTTPLMCNRTTVADADNGRLRTCGDSRTTQESLGAHGGEPAQSCQFLAVWDGAGEVGELSACFVR